MAGIDKYIRSVVRYRAVVPILAFMLFVLSKDLYVVVTLLYFIWDFISLLINRRGVR